MRRKIAIVLLIAGLLSIGARSSQGQTDKARNVWFEYQVISDPTAWQVQGMDQGQKKLNELGADGWEITGVIEQGEYAPKLYLKRVKR
jgi:hypothetical protein